MKTKIFLIILTIVIVAACSGKGKSNEDKKIENVEKISTETLEKAVERIEQIKDEAQGSQATGINAVSYSGKYADAYAASSQVADIIEVYANELEKVNNSDQFVQAMEKYYNSFKELLPRLKQIEKKYPELENEAENIKEFNELEKRIDVAAEKIAKGMMRSMEYANDPKVQAFMEKLEELDLGD